MPKVERLPSERVVVQAPMSFVGAWARSKKLIWLADGIGNDVVRGIVKACLVPIFLAIVACWWALIIAWYVIFGIFLIPYRLLRRGSRKRKAERKRHREVMDATKSAGHEE